jgi:hypothetical protein
VPKFIEETLGGSEVVILVSFWSTRENALEEIGEEHGAGERFKESEIDDGFGRKGVRAWTKQ